MVDELVLSALKLKRKYSHGRRAGILSHEGETQIRHSAHQLAQLAVVRIIFSRRSWLKATPTEGLTEAITYATFGSSKQLLNDVSFT